MCQRGPKIWSVILDDSLYFGAFLVLYNFQGIYFFYSFRLLYDGYIAKVPSFTSSSSERSNGGDLGLVIIRE